MGNYKMAHTMIRVLSLERSLDFYKEALGFEEIRRRDEPKYEFTLVFLGDGDPNGHRLELTYNYGQVVPYELGTGYGHLAVYVNDILASCADHKTKGYNPTEPKGLSSDGTPHYYFVTDPDGYRVEIIQK